MDTILAIIILVLSLFLISIIYQFIASLFARLSGRNIRIIRPGGSYTISPYKTKKEKEKEEEEFKKQAQREEIIKELNFFCYEVSSYEITHTHASKIWKIQIPLFEVPYPLSISGVPNLLSDKAQAIADNNAITKALLGYRELKTLFESQMIAYDEYQIKIFEHYQRCTMHYTS